MPPKPRAAPYTQGSSATILPAETVTWNVGYGPPGAWMQTTGGDVYAAGSITSLLPTTVFPRQFNLVGGGGFPGIVTYGASYDFDIGSGNGETLVSSKNWLVNKTFPSRDFYSYFYAKFGGTSAVDYENPTDPLAKPVSREKPYYVTGNMTTMVLGMY